MFRNLILFFIATQLIACSVFDRRQAAVPKKQVTDENYQSQKEDPSLKHRLMILPFIDASENRSPEFATNAHESFVREFMRRGQVIALNSTELKIDIKNYIEKGEYKLSDIAKEADALGASAVMEGKILDIRMKRDADKVGIVRHLKTTFEVVIRARVVTARSGREIFNTVKTVSLDQQDVRIAERVSADKFIRDNPDLIKKLVKEAFWEFIPQITSALQKQSWAGRIAAIQGDRIYLNVGRISGIQVGDVLKVAEEGEDIFDPETGGHIGKVPGRMKGTLEVISYFGNDGSISVIHSGAGFKENDLVESY